MNIAIMSDSHDHWENLKKAVSTANEHGCEVILHAGDLIAPMGIDILGKSNGNVYYVFGNNEGEKIGLIRKCDASLNVDCEGNEMDKKIGELKVFMSHYPNISELAFKTGEYDLVVYGHTHFYDIQKNDTSLMVNPGEVCGHRTGIATFAIFDTETKEVERVVLST